MVKSQKKTLTLRRESLAELSTDELVGVVAAMSGLEWCSLPPAPSLRCIDTVLTCHCP